VLAAADDEGDYLLGRNEDGKEGVLPEHVVEKLNDEVDTAETTAVAAAPETTAESLGPESKNSHKLEIAAVDDDLQKRGQASAGQPLASESVPEAAPVPVEPSPAAIPASDSQPKASGPPEPPKK
jgi:hypothetical protein